MKSNELMIGDWVQTPIDYEDGDFVYDNDRIASLGVNDFTTVEFGIEGNCGDLLPISLTAEILEKNGFVKQWNNNWQLNDCHSIIISDDFYIAIFELSTRLDYVHELQHALRLAGILKEIEL